MVMFAEITENDCVKYRHPMPKGIIRPICLVHDNWKTVRYTYTEKFIERYSREIESEALSVSIIHE